MITFDKLNNTINTNNEISRWFEDMADDVDPGIDYEDPGSWLFNLPSGQLRISKDLIYMSFDKFTEVTEDDGNKYIDVLEEDFDAPITDEIKKEIELLFMQKQMGLK